MRGLARVLAVGLFACVAGAAPLVACGGGAGGELFGTGQDGGDASSGSGAHACVPGQQVACACPGGATGAQVCTADGQGFGTCEGCGSLDGTMNPAPDSASPPHDATTIEDTAPPGDAASVDTGGTGGKDAGEDGAPGDGSAMNGTDATADATLSDAGQDATLIDAGEDATLHRRGTGREQRRGLRTKRRRRSLLARPHVRRHVRRRHHDDRDWHRLRPIR